MRVTEALIYGRMSRNNATARMRIERATEPLMTGRKIERPSQDPLHASRLEQVKRGVRRTNMHDGNIGRVRVYYQLVETTTNNVVDHLSELSAVAISMVNGALNADDKAIAAEQVSNIVDSLRALANTKHEGRFVFSGRLQDTPPYDAAGVYQGDAVGRTVPVADGFSIQADVSGPKVFGDPAAGQISAFEAAQNLETALLNNDDDAILAALEEVEAAHSNATSALSSIGFTLQDLQRFEDLTADQTVEYEIQEAQLVSADLAKAASEMQFAETVYQASLQTSSKLMEILKMEARL